MFGPTARRACYTALLAALLTAAACAPATLSQSLVAIASIYETNPDLWVANYIVPGDSHTQHIQPLEQWAATQGITVVRYEGLVQETGLVGATAYGEDGSTVVAIDKGTPPNNYLLTLLHELTHVLHGRQLARSRMVAETLAESVAYETCNRLGLNTQRESMTYLAQFSADQKSRVYQRYRVEIEQWVVLLTAAAQTQKTQKTEKKQ